MTELPKYTISNNKKKEKKQGKRNIKQANNILKAN